MPRATSRRAMTGGSRASAASRVACSSSAVRSCQRTEESYHGEWCGRCGVWAIVAASWPPRARAPAPQKSWAGMARPRRGAGAYRSGRRREFPSVAKAAEIAMSYGTAPSTSLGTGSAVPLRRAFFLKAEAWRLETEDWRLLSFLVRIVGLVNHDAAIFLGDVQQALVAVVPLGGNLAQEHRSLVRPAQLQKPGLADVGA